MKQKEKVDYWGLSDMGRQRTNNEDAFVAERLDENTILAVAIDGVGGYEGGEVAAEIAKTEIPKYLHDYRNGERIELLKQAVVSANNAIFERRKVDIERQNMSCVLTSALIDVERRVIDMVHVGDTRMYQYHSGELRKLSHDHSLIGYREEIGDLTEEQAMNHPQRNVISRDVGSERHGVSDHDFIEAAEFPLLPNSILLLCSDGLTDLITSKQIVAALAQDTTLKAKAQSLIDAANEAGGKDNITVVLVEYRSDDTEFAGIKTVPQKTKDVENNNESSDIAVNKAHSVKKIIMSVVIILLIALLVKLMCKSDTKVSPDAKMTNTDTVALEAPIQDDIDDVITTLQSAVKNGDKDAVADLIEYPLVRPYPLDDILTQEDFLAYYDKLFDAPLKNFVGKIESDKMQNNALTNEYYFTDSDSTTIYFNHMLKISNITYLSGEEKKMKKNYNKEEQSGFFEKSKGTPYCCYLSSDESMALKLEKIFADELGHAYRAIIFERNEESADLLLAQPAFIGYGDVDFQGEELVTRMEFVDVRNQKRISVDGGAYCDYYNIEVTFDSDKSKIKFHKCSWHKLQTLWMPL